MQTQKKPEQLKFLNEEICLIEINPKVEARQQSNSSISSNKTTEKDTAVVLDNSKTCNFNNTDECTQANIEFLKFRNLLLRNSLNILRHYKMRT